MLFLIPLFFFIFSLPVFAMDSATETTTTTSTVTDAIVLPEVVAEGTRLRREQRSAVVFSRERLEREAGRPIGEVLREIPGVDFVAGTSGNASLTLRGSTSAQVLVIIDGVKANDPSTPNRLFDWTRIDVSLVERVEILKGPQAVSYGSDAIGGVVLITTKRGQTGPSLRAEVGSENFYRANGVLDFPIHRDHFLRVQAMGKGIYNHAPGASASRTSPAIPKTSQEVSAGIELASKWSTFHSRVQFSLRSSEDEVDAGPFDPDPNSVAHVREIRTGLFLAGKFSNDLDWKVLLSQLYFRRIFADSIDDFHAFSSESTYRGNNSRAEFQVHHVTSSIETVLGLEGTRESLKADSLSFPTVLDRDHQAAAALFAETSVPLGKSSGISIDLGSRVSHFTSFGNESNWKAGTTYRGNFFTTDFGISTGFKAPALYSLYDPQYGNSELQPERSVALEAGVMIRFDTSSFMALRVFRSRVRDRFGFDPATFRSLNVARADVDGVEFSLDHALGSSLRVRPHLTYLRSKDHATEKPLRDIAKWKGGMKFEFIPNENSEVILSFFAKSARASGSAFRLPGYGRFDLGATHRLNTFWSLFTRVENLFDRKYSEVRGYQTPGVTAYLGAEYSVR